MRYLTAVLAFYSGVGVTVGGTYALASAAAALGIGTGVAGAAASAGEVVAETGGEGFPDASVCVSSSSNLGEGNGARVSSSRSSVIFVTRRRRQWRQRRNKSPESARQATPAMAPPALAPLFGGFGASQ